MVVKRILINRTSNTKKAAQRAAFFVYKNGLRLL